MKLELERIYKEYCDNNLETLIGEDEFVEVLMGFVKFRLHVSGGSEYGCMVSMNSVNNFLDEIFLYDNMMDDWGGCYRGDYSWENFEELERLVNESNLEEKVKIEILEGYRKENGMDEE